MTAMKNVAAVVGGFTMSYPVDRFGRKFSFIFMNILMIACCITEMFAQTPAQWIAARLIDVSEPDCQVLPSNTFRDSRSAWRRASSTYT
jgi:MFS family permease